MQRAKVKKLGWVHFFKSKYQSSFSFTLMELIVVMTVIVVLGGILLPQVNRTITNARNAKARAELEHIKSAMLAYKQDVGELPPSGSHPTEADLDGSSAASALLSDDGSSGWNGPYIESAIGTDPWGNHYRYEDNDGAANRPVSYLLSYGPNGTKDITDPQTTSPSNQNDDIYVVVYNDGD